MIKECFSFFDNQVFEEKKEKETFFYLLIPRYPILYFHARPVLTLTDPDAW